MVSLVFKFATELWEFEQIHKLNYRTFVEEIPQHPPNPEKRLVDKFHDQNTYIICLRDRRLLGMVAVRSARPCSLDAKLDNLDRYLPKHHSLCEVRLLAVEPGFRSGRVFLGLLGKLLEYFENRGHDLAVFSGIVRQLRLYEHLGCVPFGPLVGSSEALYQPMYVKVSTLLEKVPWLAESPGAHEAREEVR